MPQSAVWYTTKDANGNDQYYQLLLDARAASKAAGYDTANYKFDIVAMATIGFGWGGLGYVGGKGSWINGYYGTGGVTAHELGHNYGLWHANFWQTTDGTSIGAGSNQEYGNIFDVMGSSSTIPSGHFNNWFKNRLDWLTNGDVQTVTTSGTYRIMRHDIGTSSGLRALKIVKDSQKNYWVEFRQAFTANPYVMNGALINWGYNTNTGSHLLDMTPETSSKADAPLLIGRTFSDTAAGIHITPLGKGGTSPETLDVLVNLGSFPGNRAPSLSINPSIATIDTGVSLSFSATASDPDGDDLSYCWNFGDQTFAATATVSKAWSTGGTYPVVCTVTDRKGGTATATATISVVSSYIVTNTSDSGTGSLRAAITYANSNSGTQIRFNIPTSDTGYQSGSFVIRPLSGLPSISANGTVIDGSSQTSFTGNTNVNGPEIVLNGTNAGTSATGLTLFRANCVIKNIVIGGFSSAGIQIGGTSANNNTINGCFIGVDATGAASLANKSWGIVLYAGAHHNTIGGTVPGAGNVISGNTGVSGIELQQTGTSNNVIQGNRIGTNAAGTAALGNGRGVYLTTGAQNNLIGGAAPANSNRIAFNSSHGIYLTGTIIGNSILGNSISNNNGLGINLVGTDNAYGVTANDSGDVDTGPNNLQNFPVITAVSNGGSTGAITFTLNSNANRQYSLEFFRNTAADVSGYGEGEVFVGRQTVTTDSNGNANGTFNFSNGSGALFFTATATDLTTGDGSEFSRAVEMVAAPAVLQFSAASYSVQENGATATISVTRQDNDGGVVSVKYATSEGTARSSSDYTSSTGTLSFANGETTKTFTVPITDDTTVEGNESFNLQLSAPTGGAILGTRASAIVTIVDNDSDVSLSSSTYSVNENAGSSTITVRTFA